MAVQDNMNLPPSGASLSGNIAKSTTFMERFNGVLTKTLDMTNKIAKNMGFSGGGGNGGGNNITTTPNFSNNPSTGMGTMQGLGNTIAKVGSFVVGGMSVAATAMPGLQDTLNTQLLISQARFAGMQGNVGTQVRGMMNTGTSNSAYDAIQAVSQGTAAGLIPSLPGYGGVMSGVSQISNLTGSQTGAMQAATALNTGASVNRLRQFGINVRSAQGTMRNPSEIFKDIYNFAQRQSGKKLTQQDIAIGMQSGNGLANFMDFVSGGDSTLRGALQNAALQYSQGGDLSKASLTKTGMLTEATNAQSSLNASKFGVTVAAAPAMSQGFVEGAALLSKFNGRLEDLLGSSKLANDALKQIAKAETMAADNLGQAGIGLVALITSALAGLGLGSKAPLPSVGSTVGSTAAATTAGTVGKAGFLNKFLGPIGIFLAGRQMVGQAKDGMSLSVLTGKRIPDPSQSYLSQVFQGTRYINSTDTGGMGLGASTGPSSTSVNTASSAGAAVVGVAAAQQGVPYSWGGGNLSGPTTGIGRGKGTVGFDCSSLVRFVMAKTGVILPRTANEQQKCGIQIDPRQAQPGDLLFWGTPAHHVGIYAGNGMMIQAPHTGGNVEKVAVNLDGVTSCSRVLNGATGTASLGNLLDSSGGSVLGAGIDALLASVSNNTPSGGSNLFANADLVGYSPESAMSGGKVSGSGMGLGGNTSSYGGSNTNMAQQYLYVNTKTGVLETSNGASAGTVNNYGGVTIKVETKGQNMTPRELGKAISEELKNIGINSRVVTK